MIHKNEEGDEIIHFLKRDHLALDDPRYETPRHRRRRAARGITAKSIQFKGAAASLIRPIRRNHRDR